MDQTSLTSQVISLLSDGIFRALIWDIYLRKILLWHSYFLSDSGRIYMNCTRRLSNIPYLAMKAGRKRLLVIPPVDIGLLYEGID